MAFRFLKSFFLKPSSTPEKYADSVIKAAIERVVEGTDPRLRAVPRYRHKLWDAVAHSIKYTVALVHHLPPATDVSVRAFGNTPMLRAAFVSAQQWREAVSFSKSMHNYQHQRPGLLPAELYGVLSMERVEKSMLGIGLQGELIRRDVPKTVVTFRDHHFTFPSEDELQTRQAFTKRTFDSLIEAALSDLTTSRSRREHLEQQQRHLLQKKANALRSGQMGLGTMLAAEPLKEADAATLERQLLDIQEELMHLHTDTLNLEQVLARVVTTFQAPEKHLRFEQVTLELDHMNAKITPDSTHVGHILNLHEVVFDKERRNTLILVRFPTNELLPQPDFFQEAQRLLTPRLMT